MKVRFLGLEEILELHRDQIAQYGGSEGVRDLGLLKSAATMPMAQFGGQYLHGDVFEMAAAYLFHIVQNHPFVDGNKRTGLACADMFLSLNGFDLNGQTAHFAGFVLSIAQGKVDKSTITRFLRDHSKKGGA